jgi:hypothetical protein
MAERGLFHTTPFWLTPINLGERMKKQYRYVNEKYRQAYKKAEKKFAEQEGERPVDEEPVSNCCTAPFTYPGWPDSDFCSQCHEHADTGEEECH